MINISITYVHYKTIVVIRKYHLKITISINKGMYKVFEVYACKINSKRLYSFFYQKELFKVQLQCINSTFLVLSSLYIFHNIEDKKYNYCLVYNILT